jgi:hypothetical protein
VIIPSTPMQIRQKIEMLLGQAESLRDNMVRKEAPFQQNTVDNYHQLLAEAKLWIKYYDALKA